MEPLTALFVLIIVAFTVAAVYSDVRTRRIPNWLTVSALVLALAVHGVVGGLGGLGFALAGFAVGFGILFVLWALGGGGGGDVKMMGALGAWLGLTMILQVFVVSAMVTVILAFGRRVALYFSKRLEQREPRRFKDKAIEKRIETERKKNRWLVPYAVPLALSTWIVLVAAWRSGTLPY